MTPSSWREKEETINCLIYEGEILLKFKHIHDDSALIFFFFSNESYIKLQWGPESWLLCIISCLFPSGPQVILWNPRITWNMVCENHCSSSTTHITDEEIQGEATLCQHSAVLIGPLVWNENVRVGVPALPLWLWDLDKSVDCCFASLFYYNS